MITVTSVQRSRRVSIARIRRVADRALRALGRRAMDVHVTLVDDPTIRRLNARYLGIRRPTDVLAFDLDGPGPAARLAEVIVSVDTAARQARAVRVPVALEVDLLVVHGLLHLAGYDDDRPAAARRMHRRARAILSSCRSHGRAMKVPERLWTGLIEGP